jgi:hypothetical protein
VSQHWKLVEVGQQFEHDVSLLDRTERQFLDHVRMTTNLVNAQKFDKLGLVNMQVVNPDRSVDQDHRDGARRRGAAVARGSVPPSAANRRALSTRMSVSKPWRSSVDFSFVPVSSAAFASNASSMVTVVLIDPPHQYMHRLMHIMMRAQRSGNHRRGTRRLTETR